MELVTSKPEVPAWHALHKTEATDLSKTLHNDSSNNSSSNQLSASSSATEKRHTLDWSCISDALAFPDVSVHATEHISTSEITHTEARAATLPTSIRKSSIKTASTTLSV